MSVIMAAYNAAPHLEAALASIRAQTLDDLEIVIVDDGSTDATPEVLARARRQDGRLSVIRQDNRGLTHALARAIGAAGGEYLARHDADDISAPERLERQARFLDAHPSVGAVGAVTELIDELGAPRGVLPTVTGPGAVRRGLWTLRDTPVHGAMMIRRAALDAAGSYREGFRFAQDYDLWLRMAERFDLDNLPDILYRWRVSPHGVYATRRALQLRYCAVALVFAWERRRFGADSYDRLDACGEDFASFLAGYRLRGRLHALLGELLLRSGADPVAARTHLIRALAGGFLRPWAIGLLGWSVTGLGWPGRGPIRVEGVRR